LENLIWATILWAAVLTLIPFERIKELWPVAVLSALWLFIVNYFSIKLGYFEFTKYFVLISGVPPFHIIGGAAGGLLLINFLPRKPLNKIFLIIIASVFIYLSEYIFGRLGAFEYGTFNSITSFIQIIAAFSILIWLSLALLGEEKIYNGNKIRFKY
jgi:hypothetical protein